MSAPEGYRIRLAREGELPLVQFIEADSARLFAPYGLAELFGSLVTPTATLRDGLERGHLFVAATLDDDAPIGFALLSRIDDHAHLDELDVLPEHGRRGVGRALVEHVCRVAAREGQPRITLSTLRSIPWNAPFYAKLGFTEIAAESLTAALRAILGHEREGGFPMDERVMMERPLTR